MKRIHVITITFLCGMLTGLVVPQPASAAMAPKQFTQDFVIDSVDTDACAITLDTGDVYSVDCDEMEDFQPGEVVTLDTRDHWSTLETEYGSPVMVEEMN